MRALPLHPSARGLEDDCAVLELGSETLIITHDMMAEGTHFRADADMADVAWKLVATNLSDLAAKGAQPVGVLLGHCLSADSARFIVGLEKALRAHNVLLLGGDTIATKGPSVFGLTAIGKATHTPVPSRSGARVGDAIYVTGILGRAMLGFEGAAEHLDAFNRPRPSLAEGQTLAPHVTAMMDVSDGLLLDAYRMATASNCTFDIASKYVPVADEARRAQCMRWGDDYELLFTAPEDAELPVLATKIGHVIAHDIAPLWLDGELISEPDQLGYQH
ncbi:thiamine-phosphate kinase [Qipengyuania sp. DGS5-3]|uniref:thiamine-phosphate kinase n=1 Tax=Qipengyuania sp. DGS5-3 TaxID=3349632 RepID=UPI0036D212AC